MNLQNLKQIFDCRTGNFFEASQVSSCYQYELHQYLETPTEISPCCNRCNIYMQQEMHIKSYHQDCPSIKEIKRDKWQLRSCVIPGSDDDLLPGCHLFLLCCTIQQLSPFEEKWHHKQNSYKYIYFQEKSSGVEKKSIYSRLQVTLAAS